MDQFEYVMVLVSIIVGLGIANILLGIGAIVDRVSRKEGRLEPSWAHAMWLLYCFTWLVMFWWWEYRFSTRVADWTLGLYLFLVCYAVTLFLIQAILVPRSWDSVSSLKEFFLERRVWFYCLLAFVTILDHFDSYLKGGFEYILSGGYAGMGYNAAIFLFVVIGIMATTIRPHNIMATILFVWQIVIAFDFNRTLAS